MKIIHFSDTHIHDELILGQDSDLRFKKALEHISKNHLDADLFVITGDLTHHGLEKSYEKFIKILDDANLPSHLFPKLIIGNHDNSEMFKKKFPKVPVDENGHIQYELDFQSNRFLFLDTNLPKSHQGHYCNKRMTWLENKLNVAQSQDIDVFIFMHHNPLATAEESSDYLGIQEKKELQSLLLKYSKNVKHIFFGHQHLTVSGKLGNISFSAPRSISHPLVTNYSKKYRLGTAHTDPNYNIILIKKESIIIHTEDFLKQEVEWFETTQEDWVEDN